MTNVVEFPKPLVRRPKPKAVTPDREVKARVEPPKEEARAPEVNAPSPAPSGAAKFARGLVRLVWVAVVLAWPLVRWVVSLDVAFQFARMVWYWGEPGKHALATFALHFAVLVLLTYFVTYFKPKGL